MKFLTSSNVSDKWTRGQPSTVGPFSGSEQANMSRNIGQWMDRTERWSRNWVCSAWMTTFPSSNQNLVDLTTLIWGLVSSSFSSTGGPQFSVVVDCSIPSQPVGTAESIQLVANRITLSRLQCLYLVVQINLSQNRSSSCVSTNRLRRLTFLPPNIANIRLIIIFLICVPFSSMQNVQRWGMRFNESCRRSVVDDWSPDDLPNLA